MAATWLRSLSAALGLSVGLLVCGSLASAQIHLIRATDFAVGSTPSVRTFPDGFTATFINPTNAAIAPFTTVQTPANGNSIFGNNTIFLDTSPTNVTSVEIDFNSPITSFVATAGVVTAGTAVNFDTKVYNGATLVGDNPNIVTSNSSVFVTGNFTFSGGSFNRVILAPSFNPAGTFIPETFGVTSILVTSVPEPGSIAILVSLGTMGAGFLARRSRERCARRRRCGSR